MKKGGRRGTARCAAAVILSISTVGCVSETADEPRTGAAATSSAQPPSPSPTPETPPRELVAQAFRRLQIAVKRVDGGSSFNMLAPATRRSLNYLQRIVATGGPEAIARLSPWQKIVLTFLRTDYPLDLIEGLSTERFFGYAYFTSGLDYFPTNRLSPRNVKITGPRTAVAVIGGSPVWFQLVDGSWRVDLRGVFELGSDVTRRLAERHGLTVEQVILAIAEDRTRKDVSPDVWEKP